MQEPKIFSVYDLKPVENICRQILREAISLPAVSMAHVTMDIGNESLLHKHSKMHETYFILAGTGILHYGNNKINATKSAYASIPPDTAHKLKNTGNANLDHLVFASPPFDPKDITLLKDDSGQSQQAISTFKHSTPPITALDGAIIYEILTAKERKSLGYALATGTLPPLRKAIPHYHKISEEVYYVISGSGKISVGDLQENISKGSIIYVPINTVHALENTNNKANLEVLCLSSPAYVDGDFLFKQ